MVSYIVLTKKITIIEALKIRENHSMEFVERNSASTKVYKDDGVSKLGVWSDSSKGLNEGEVSNCTLNATIRAQKFMKDGFLDVDAVIHMINAITSRDGVIDREWKLQNAMFEFYLSEPYATEYMELLNYCTHDEKGGLKKSVDKKISPSKILFVGKGVKLNIDRVPDSVEVKCALWLGKNRLTDLPEAIGVKNRVFEQYRDKLSAIEQYLWQHYLKKVFGTGNFYSYRKAVELVEASDFGKTDINNMLSVLRGVAYYKGVDKYINHIVIGDISEKIGGKIKAKSTADRYISMLQRQELRVNPVTIGKGTLAKESNMIVEETIPGLLSVVEQTDVTRFVKRPWKESLRSEDELFEESIAEETEENKKLIREHRKILKSIENGPYEVAPFT